MRRIFAFFLALALSLSACRENTPEPTSAAPTPSPTVEPTPTPEPLSEDGALLIAFVNGENEAVVDESFYDGGLWDNTLVEAGQFTVQELFQRLGEFESSEEDAPQGGMSYTLMKTLGGKEMLVLYYVPVAAIGPNTYIVFGVFDGQVRMTYAVTYAYRFLVDLCQSLVFSAQGSGGAGYHYYWGGYIDETGHYRELYYSTTLFGLWVQMDAGIDIDGDETEGLMCVLLTLDGKEYYELGADAMGTSADPAMLARVREQLNNQGREETDSVDDLIADAYVARGFSAKPELYDGSWLSLELN